MKNYSERGTHVGEEQYSISYSNSLSICHYLSDIVQVSHVVVNLM